MCSNQKEYALRSVLLKSNVLLKYLRQLTDTVEDQSNDHQFRSTLTSVNQGRRSEINNHAPTKPPSPEVINLKLSTPAGKDTHQIKGQFIVKKSNNVVQEQQSMRRSHNISTRYSQLQVREEIPIKNAPQPMQNTGHFVDQDSVMTPAMTQHVPIMASTPQKSGRATSNLRDKRNDYKRELSQRKQLENTEWELRQSQNLNFCIQIYLEIIESQIFRRESIIIPEEVKTPMKNTQSRKSLAATSDAFSKTEKKQVLPRSSYFLSKYEDSGDQSRKGLSDEIKEKLFSADLAILEQSNTPYDGIFTKYLRTSNPFLTSQKDARLAIVSKQPTQSGIVSISLLLHTLLKINIFYNFNFLLYNLDSILLDLDNFEVAAQLNVKLIVARKNFEIIVDTRLSIYFVGGFQPSSNQFYNRICMIDLEDNSTEKLVTEIPIVTATLKYFTCCSGLINGESYLIISYSPTANASFIVLLYNAATSKWADPLPDLNITDFTQYKMTVIDNELYIIGGCCGISVIVRKVFKFSFKTNTWDTLPDMTDPRINFAIIGDLVIGGYDGEKALATIESIKEQQQCQIEYMSIACTHSLRISESSSILYYFFFLNDYYGSVAIKYYTGQIVRSSRIQISKQAYYHICQA